MSYKVKNSTGDDLREGVRVTSASEQDLPGSRGVANFALKLVMMLYSASWAHCKASHNVFITCSSTQIRWVKDAKAAAYLNVVPVKKVTRDYTGKWCQVAALILLKAYAKQQTRTPLRCLPAAQDDRQFVSIIGFECRGMDVVNWHPEVRVHSDNCLSQHVHVCAESKNHMIDVGVISGILATLGLCCTSLCTACTGWLPNREHLWPDLQWCGFIRCWVGWLWRKAWRVSWHHGVRAQIRNTQVMAIRMWCILKDTQPDVAICWHTPRRSYLLAVREPAASRLVRYASLSRDRSWVHGMTGVKGHYWFICKFVPKL